MNYSYLMGIEESNLMKIKKIYSKNRMEGKDE